MSRRGRDGEAARREGKRGRKGRRGKRGSGREEAGEKGKERKKRIKKMKRRKKIINLTYFVGIDTSKGGYARYYRIILKQFNTSNTSIRNRSGIYSHPIIYRKTMLR